MFLSKAILTFDV